MTRLIAQQQVMKFLFIDRFRQIVIHPGAQQLLFLARHRVRGDRNHRRLLLMRQLVDQLTGAMPSMPGI
jgi:hypothetical protein